MLILSTESAVNTFKSRAQISVGAELGVSVGPVGRSIGACALRYSYSLHTNIHTYIHTFIQRATSPRETRAQVRYLPTYLPTYYSADLT